MKLRAEEEEARLDEGRGWGMGVGPRLGSYPTSPLLVVTVGRQSVSILASLGSR